MRFSNTLALRNNYENVNTNYYIWSRRVREKYSWKSNSGANMDASMSSPWNQAKEYCHRKYQLQKESYPCSLKSKDGTPTRLLFYSSHKEKFSNYKGVSHACKKHARFRVCKHNPRDHCLSGREVICLLESWKSLANWREGKHEKKGGGGEQFMFSQAADFFNRLQPFQRADKR
jgi:hypothetical protein